MSNFSMVSAVIVLITLVFYGGYEIAESRKLGAQQQLELYKKVEAVCGKDNILVIDLINGWQDFKCADYSKVD